MRAFAAAMLGASLMLSGCMATIARRSQDDVRADIASGVKQRATDGLCTALAWKWNDLAKQALDAGADPNGRSSDHGIHVVHYAVSNENLEGAKLLYERGTDPMVALNDRTYAGYGDHTAVEYLELLKKRDIALFLRDAASQGRMRPAANIPPGKPTPSSDVDAPARRGAERPDDFALVIGIEKYSRLPEARFAENDADAMKKHLLALGYPERNIVVLKGGQATRGAISGYVEEWLPRNAKPASRVFVYFSGHGSPDAKSGDAYLVPWDGDAMFLKSTAYPLKSLYASLGKLKAKRVLVALDSCFSGAGGRSVLAEGARPLVTRVDEVAAPAGVTVLSAASGDEITATIKEQGHGAFTYYMLKAVGNGKLTAKAAYDELKPLVQDEAHRQNREQTPLLLGDDASF